jgi:hypothetical protein
LDELDFNQSNDIQKYYHLIRLLKGLNLDFQEKFIFQADLTTSKINLSIDETLKNDIKDAMYFVDKVTNKNENINLTNFKKSFYDRYENRLMPLTLALDEEIGLGYPINMYKSGMNELIEGLNFAGESKKDNKAISVLDGLILKKMIECKMNNTNIIEIFENEISGFSSDWDIHPETFSTIAQIVNLNNSRKIIFESLFASSSANVLGRFCHSNPDIDLFVKKIVSYEQDANSDKILAEIVHLPENRVGNILLRPSMREHEITYLSNSSKNPEFQINVNDILIGIRNDKLILINKSDGKEISPYLGNAHNHSSSTIPVYRFLCDMQHYKIKSDVFFDYSFLMREFSYVPRIIYKNVILSTMKWSTQSDYLLKIKNDKKEDPKIIKSITEWRKMHGIPQYAYFVNGDNKLLINFCNINCINVLFTEIKSKPSFFLEEFLFDDGKISINENNEQFVNELVFSFFKN